jgi:ribosome-binding protein aMBF1 (putative translation factor)
MSKSKYNNTNAAAAGVRVPDCQDWTPITLGKTKNVKENNTLATSASASASAAATTSAADDTTKKTKYVAKATSDTIRQTRCDKKLTQKELAQKCNMDVSIIAEIERGGNCVYNATHVNKIQSVLGVKIPRV